jgi:chromosome segregation protein
MLLTKLEIKGFKSFADKIVINFDKGITGIVGPNGCGKSNVVDAIRWVLGEQRTKNLRSDKMENIIFNGTKDRKPTQLAEVSLTFDNNKGLLPTEYSTVTITRRLFRTGDSEYLLNGVGCRLKDINNLFLDTGIGSDSYAIIELKMIDELLNDNNNSRRGLFEEAAGISKFKIRKKETLKKLEETDADLERVDDLLFEIVKNLKTLEKQAKQAEKYFATKAEYKRLSIEVGKKVLDRQANSLANLQAKLNTEKLQRIETQQFIEKNENEIEAIKLKSLDKEKLYNSRQKTLQEHINKIRQYESDKRIRQERLKLLQEKQQNITQQQQEDKQNLQFLHEQLAKLQIDKENATKKVTETEQILHSLKADLDKQKAENSGLQQNVSEFSKQIKTKQEELYQAKKALEINQLQYNSLRQELEKSANADSQQRQSLTEFDDRIADLKEEIAEIETEIKTVTQDEENRQTQLVDKQLFTDKLREELALQNRSVDALQNEYNLTKSLVDNLEGFPEAIKYLKKNVESFKNIPLLSDILTCEPQYRVAIENFLEPYMNCYIVATENEAFVAIELLSDKQKGKASFFVLENLQNIDNQVVENKDNMISALQIVEFDEQYRNLLSALLANVFIIEDEKTLQGLKDLVRFNNFTLLSKKGKIIYKPYTISGGSVGVFEGKRIGRAKNLEKLQIEIAKLKTEISAKTEVLQTENLAITNLKNATQTKHIANLQRQLSEKQQSLIAVWTKQEQLANLLKNNELRKEDMQEKMQILKDEMLDNEPLIKSLLLELQTVEQLLSAANTNLITANELQNQQSNAYNQQNLAYYQSKNQVENLQKEIEFRSNNLENITQRIARNQQEITNAKIELEKLENSNEVGEEELENLQYEKLSIEAGVAEAEKDYFSSRGDITETEKNLRDLTRKRDGIDVLVMELQNKVNESLMQVTAVKDRLSVEFEVDLEAEMRQNAEISPLAEEFLREEQRKAKDALEKIGSINPMAMEAYNEIKERHDFIVAQKDDLLRAKTSLLTTVSEIDTVAKDTFLSAFEKIRANFQVVFRSLFTEDDTCDLYLADANDVLESKIEIMAKPKGKRPLTINQLSGGEKTLTATALLFSIYLLRPAPFCIFDEVDAPLDDANVDKFNNIIRKFSDNSQFIIVTHNKRTMSATDIMYGVTMIEQGVSRVVAVDLREI